MLKIPLNENTLIDFLRKIRLYNLEKAYIAKKKYLEDKKLHLDTQDLKNLIQNFVALETIPQTFIFIKPTKK